ncbi:GT2 family glycosyltransferase [Georgenia soli]|uniref:GT2 family glycosyltransferase n=1 Tax=Georgenia soli TaxID=638953 RepID=A0A2A9ENT7_9MICO|nr:glycosyltransferase [Georgenia soli]PFG39922.1 GT2 family glycosyltransferase [Georgenia soli]
MSAAVEDSRVTVVVASRNRREELLASLARHRAPVIYVDNASTDGSVEAVREAHPHVEIVRLRRNAGAFARTIGVRRARTPFVAFADDDSWWAPASLARAAGTLARNPHLGLLNAHILVGAEERTDTVCDLMARSPLPAVPGMSGVPILGFVACAAMVRRDAFLAVGGFDPVVRFPGEEERVALDLATGGWALSYLDDVVIHHHPSPVRHSPDRRTRAITRSAVLTAVMRLPWRDVVGRVRDAWQAGGPRRDGVRDALRDLPAAVRTRRPAPPEVLELLTLLDDDAPAPRPADASAVVTERRAPAWAGTTEDARVGAGSYGGDV